MNAMNDLYNQKPPVIQPATRMPRAAWIAGGGLLVACGALAAALVMREPSVAPEAQATAAENVAQNTAPAKPLSQPRVVTAPTKTAAPVCLRCGTVESVRQVQVKGEGTGVGAVAGGVLGGVVGNQIGGGNGRTAMTVLGAVGGGVAGHEVEKRARGETVQQVRIRMDDGSLRTLSLAQAPVMAGDRVSVDGEQLRRL